MKELTIFGSGKDKQDDRIIHDLTGFLNSGMLDEGRE